MNFVSVLNEPIYFVLKNGCWISSWTLVLSIIIHITIGWPRYYRKISIKKYQIALFFFVLMTWLTNISWNVFSSVTVKMHNTVAVGSWIWIWSVPRSSISFSIQDNAKWLMFNQRWFLVVPFCLWHHIELYLQ